MFRFHCISMLRFSQYVKVPLYPISDHLTLVNPLDLPSNISQLLPRKSDLRTSFFYQEIVYLFCMVSNIATKILFSSNLIGFGLCGQFSPIPYFWIWFVSLGSVFLLCINYLFCCVVITVLTFYILKQCAFLYYLPSLSITSDYSLNGFL